MSARETALNVLMACRLQAGWSNGVLKEYLHRDGLDRRDGALAARLCYGVLQNRGKLDFYLGQLLTGRVKDLHPVIRDILHLGLYQLYEMDKIPVSAAVNESVSLAKKYCKKQRFAPGLVNAVLRNAGRSMGKLKEPTALEDRFSHPRDLIRLLEDSLGRERLLVMLAADNSAPQTIVQVNTLKTDRDSLMAALQREGVTAQPHGWLPDCLVLSGTGDLERLEAFRQGLFYVQDPAAKLAVLCADLPAEKLRILDCCAAPGGKSFAAAIATEGKASIISCDVHPHKVELIRSGAARLGMTGVETRIQDATENVAQWHGQMDAVIADVPCSGLGIIRKKPDIRYKKLDELTVLPELQIKILIKQADYVKPGGVLIYSTCTVLRRENEAVVEAFLHTRPDFAPEPLPSMEGLPENRSGMLTLVPGEYDTDGFFICRLRRRP